MQLAVSPIDIRLVILRSSVTWNLPFVSRGTQRDIMIISDVLPVMVDDALLSSHPIIVNVSSPAEITSVFDTISYSKVQLLESLTQ